MRITIVLGAFFPVPPTMGGGVEKVWFSLAPEFVKHGHEVVMVSRKMPDLPREEMIDGVKHLRVDGFGTPRSLVWLKFLDLIYSVRALSILPEADIIVTNTFWFPILSRDPKRGRICVQVARYPKGQMRFYRKAARLQAPSRAVADAIKLEVPKLADKVAVLPNPVPQSAIVPAPIDSRDKTMLFVGRLHPEKGVHVLIEAFVSRAQGAFADWKLMVVGPIETKLGGGGENYLRSLQEAAATAEAKIDFTGPIFDSAKLAEVYRRARLFIYPSLSERGESFGLAPLEAMAHGCGVIVSDLACFREFIRDTETGFIFDHCTQANTELLGDKLDNIVSNQTLLARVAAAGYEKSKEYSAERVVGQFLKDFESLIPKNVSSPDC